MTDTIERKDENWNPCDDNCLHQPKHWRKPRRIFVCAYGDLFHDDVPDEWIDKVFAIMALCPQHMFRVLTKRAARMREYCCGKTRHADIRSAISKISTWPIDCLRQDAGSLPLPNVHLGVSVEDQQQADDRIPPLLDTPATFRFVIAEPLLGPIDLTDLRPAHHDGDPNSLTGRQIYSGYNMAGARDSMEAFQRTTGKLDQVIVGASSSPSAETDSSWTWAIRDQCSDAGVAFCVTRRKPK